MNSMTLQGPLTRDTAASSGQPDAIDLLTDDQHHVLAIYAHLMAHESPAEERHTVEALCDAIEAHMAAEEEVLYPAVEPAPALAHAANRNRSSHAMIRAHIQHIQEQLRRHMNYEDELRYLMADVERYFEEEAASLLAESRRYLPLEVRRQLGREMLRRRALIKPAQARGRFSWSRVGHAYRRRPAPFLLGIAGLALLTLATFTRRRQHMQARSLPG